jgi:predicted membrane chloride channel (bestrophin family)
MMLPAILIVLFLQLTRSIYSEPETHFFTERTLTLSASIVSIISFFLTIFVLYDTRKLRSFYKFRALGPTLIRELRSSSKRISDFLNEFEEFIPQISQELARAGATLHSLQRKLRGSPKTSTKKLRKRISVCRIGIESEDEIREIHIEMVKVVEEVKNYQRDLEWER